MVSQELAIRAKENSDAISDLEREASDGTERVKQLETALAVCQEELKVIMNQMEEVRTRNDKEIQSKMDKVRSVTSTCKPPSTRFYNSLKIEPVTVGQVNDAAV